jgi:hypothetical protein
MARVREMTPFKRGSRVLRGSVVSGHAVQDISHYLMRVLLHDSVIFLLQILLQVEEHASR